MREEGDVIFHIGKYINPETDTLKPGDQVELAIYPGFRETHARIHSAGHLLDVAMRRAGRKDMKPHKGYHFEKGSYVEYIGVVPAEERD